jgi:8-oxo-dGTP pyrophosphatase MutT (NUDIX family)
VKAKKSGIYESAGGIVWRDDGAGGRQLALVRRPRYGDWSLPKGTLDEGETWQEAAVREVEEETNCVARPGEFAGCTCYLVRGVPKVVLFWHMEVVEERLFTPNEETDELVWVTAEEAVARMSYDGERALLAKV